MKEFKGVIPAKAGIHFKRSPKNRFRLGGRNDGVYGRHPGEGRDPFKAKP